MSKAVAFTRHFAFDGIEVLRCAIVVTCACALIAAG